MTHKKIILGTIAFIITAAGSLAFKANKKFGRGVVIRGHTRLGGACKVSTCNTTVNGGASNGLCTTIITGNALLDHYKDATCLIPAYRWTNID